jgi:hypothetical protein
MKTSLHWLAALAVAVVLLTSFVPAQSPRPRERHIDPELNVQDKADIWTMEFDFLDPRMKTVDIPGRGKKVVWYLIYRLVNRTDAPHTVIPDFEMVVPDKGITLNDEVLPSVQEEIRQREDPTNRYNMQNSVTISRTPIPVTKPESAPRAITGVAIFADVNDKARDLVDFRIFVSGISNGWSIDDEGKIRRKTLELKFKRLGDGTRVDNSEIRFDGSRWIYRFSSANVDLKPPASVQPAKEKK